MGISCELQPAMPLPQKHASASTKLGVNPADPQQMLDLNSLWSGTVPVLFSQKLAWDLVQIS